MAVVKRIAAAKRFGNKAYFGDAARTDILAAAGMGHADMGVVTIDDAAATTGAIRAIRHSLVQARGQDRWHIHPKSVLSY